MLQHDEPVLFPKKFLKPPKPPLNPPMMITETYPYFEIQNRKEQCKLIK
jgi:hypothetical protein